MREGYAVIDPGATKTMASITALECAREVSWRDNQKDNITGINVDERPTFGFADSETAQCRPTVLLSLPVAEQRMKLKVHALDKGSVPLLLSIQTMKKMGALMDFGRVIFTNINPQKCVSLQTTATGHQMLPLTRDFMKEARDLKAPVFRLGDLVSE